MATKKKIAKQLVSVVIVTKDRKKDLEKCVSAFLKSDYKPLEIIVVDNDSRPPLVTWFEKKYPKVNLVTSDQNLGAAEGRNWGARVAKGDYLLFSDDDAYPAKDMISKLVEAFKSHKKAGIIQPLVYDNRKKNYLQGAGHNIDLLTGRIEADGVQEKDIGQYDGVREVPLCGCVWMVSRKAWEVVGEYDEDYFIPYEDSDYSMRARESGFKNYCTSEAKTWHQGKKTTYVHPRLEWLGITSSRRAYRIARNKIIYMKKHSPFPKNIIFFFVILPITVVLQSIIILSTLKLDIFTRYILGLFAGIAYIFYSPLLNLREEYKKLDTKLVDFKLLVLAWVDPLPWIVDREAKTFLDLACGQGKPMQMIKRRMKVKKAVGVDLFEPYIKEAREMKIHDEYVLKDIRKIKYPKNSFDVVIASHVLEHMTKKEAMKVLKNMESIAAKQVIIATPIGEMYHHAVDGNELQLHKCHFYPEDFEKLGYKTVKYGWSWLLGEGGLVHRTRNDLVRKILYTFNILMTPFYYIFQDINDYTFVAYKNLDEEKTNK